jgi:hypothetical protein
MIESTLEVGPLTPQELEDVCEKLKSQGITFEVLKDEESEKSEMTNDYDNVASKVGWRTHGYLGQIFYLRLNQSDFLKNQSLFSELGLATTPKENPEELDADITQVHKDAQEQEDLKRMSARSLAFLWITIWFCLMYFVVTDFFKFSFF